MPADAPALTPVRSVVLAESGRGCRQWRIPAFVVTARGTLLAAFDGRPDLDDLPAPVDLVVTRSRDGGRSWSAAAPLRAGTGITGHGDASLLVDHVTGAVLCFHATSGRAGFFESSTGTDNEDPTIQHVDLAVSDDDGLTWSVRRLSSDLRTSCNARLHRSLGESALVSGLFAASGAGVQVPSGQYAGRLLQGFVALVGREVYAVVGRSDDHGATWAMGAPVGPGANETAVAAVPDGRIVLQCRAPGARLQAWSEDGGDTFGPLRPVPSLPDPGNNGSLVVLGPQPAGGGERTAYRLVATHTRDPHLRRALTVSVASGTADFVPAVELTPGGGGYSVAQPLQGGDLGVVWEDAGYRRILFTRVPAAALDSRVRERPVEPALVLDHVLGCRPDRWPDDPASVEVPLDLTSWDPAVFKIVDATAGRQIVRSRTAYRRALGEPRPGLGVGDVLTLSARLPLAAPLTALALDGDEQPQARVTALPEVPGGWCLVRGLRRIVTAADLAAGTVTVHLVAHAEAATAELTLDVPLRPTGP